MANSWKNAPASHFYHRVLPYTKPHWRIFALAIFGMAVCAASEAGFAVLIKPLVDEGLVPDDPGTLSLWLPMLILATMLARAIGSFIGVYFLSAVGQHVMHALRADLFHHIVHSPVVALQQHGRGAIVGKMSYNIQLIAYSITKLVTVLVKDSLTAIALSGWLIYINWQMSLGFLLVLPLIVVSVWIAARRFRQVSKRIQKIVGVVAEQVQQAVQANPEIKVFNAQESEQRSFKKSNDYAFEQGMKFSLARALASPVAMLLAGLSFVLVLYWVISGTIQTDSSPGTLASFLVALLLLFSPLRNLVRFNSAIQPSIAAAEALFEFIDEPIEQVSPRKTCRRRRGELRFESVSLRYANNKQDALQKIDLSIAAHETVAIVGHSGSGKTSLANLVPRFYEPDSGRVLIDGCDIKDLDLFELREQISYVGQSANLLNDTVAGNIAYGIDSDRERIVEAARLAHALEFIEKLPQGFDTQLSNDGSGLSAGERQRIAIARAFVKAAPILILDEATSALDAVSESTIRQAIETIRKNCTTLLIAHRLSIIQHIPHIVVMSGGHIVEQGNHQSLIELSGVYANMCSHYNNRII